jgi:hypothetical protein
MTRSWTLALAFVLLGLGLMVAFHNLNQHAETHYRGPLRGLPDGHYYLL